MLYELATGIHPFAAPDSITTIARILEAEPSPLTRFRPILPAELIRSHAAASTKRPARAISSLTGSWLIWRNSRSVLTRCRLSSSRSQIPDVAAPGRLHPKWWWQFHQAVIGFLYYAMLYPMWKSEADNSGGWGALLFFMCVAAVAVAANLRFHLWFTSGFYAAELAISVGTWPAGPRRGHPVCFFAANGCGGHSRCQHPVHNFADSCRRRKPVRVFCLSKPTTTRAGLRHQGLRDKGAKGNRGKGTTISAPRYQLG